MKSKSGEPKYTNWTIYAGVIDRKYSNDIFKKTINSSMNPIQMFATIAEPIEETWWNNQPIPDDNLIGFTVVNSHYEDSPNKFGVFTKIESGKNLGKINQTNIFTQSLASGLQKYTAKETKSEHYLPMLADGSAIDPDKVFEIIQDLYSKYGSNNYFQYKYDGVRLISGMSNDDKLISYSRSGKSLEISKTLQEQLEELHTVKYSGRNIFFDGELYIHGEPLSNISGYSNKQIQDSYKEQLNYYIYDIFIPTTPTSGIPNNFSFKQRNIVFDKIRNKYEGKLGNIKFAPTFQFDTPEEAYEFYQKAINDKYEGLIFRIGDRPYNGGSRNEMVKIKPLFRDEFQLFGFKDGVGKNFRKVIFICKHTKNSYNNAIEYMNKRFDSFSEYDYGPDVYDINSSDYTVTIQPKLSDEVRAELFYDMSQMEENGKTHFENNYKGKLYTVEFRGYSIKTLLPTQAIGIDFRPDL